MSAGSGAGARFYAPELDGMRFIAAFAVFMHHAPEVVGLEWLKHYGWVGVDLFLCISAYLITKLVLLEIRNSGRFDLKAFYIRRALRIWPLYLGYVTAIIAVNVLAGKSEAAEALAWWLSHLSFTNNLLTAALGYSPVMFTSHLWTISLEEQAYMVLPVVLMLTAREKPLARNILAVGLAIIAALVMARVAFTIGRVAHPFIWTLPLRADAFVLGCVAALIGTDQRRSAALLIPAGVLILAVGLVPAVTSPTYQVIGYTVVSMGSVLAIVGGRSPSPIRSVLASPPLRYLGKISFGIYVYHMVAIYIADVGGKAFGMPLSIETLVAWGLTLAMAAISYHVYETPFLRLKERYARVKSRPI